MGRRAGWQLRPCFTTAGKRAPPLTRDGAVQLACSHVRQPRVLLQPLGLQHLAVRGVRLGQPLGVVCGRGGGVW